MTSTTLQTRARPVLTWTSHSLSRCVSGVLKVSISQWEASFTVSRALQTKQRSLMTAEELPVSLSVLVSHNIMYSTSLFIQTVYLSGYSLKFPNHRFVFFIHPSVLDLSLIWIWALCLKTS